MPACTRAATTSHSTRRCSNCIRRARSPIRCVSSTSCPSRSSAATRNCRAKSTSTTAARTASASGAGSPAAARSTSTRANWAGNSCSAAARLPGSSLGDIARAICEAAAAGLSGLGIDARFRPRNDIEVDGRKLSGTGGFFDGDSMIYQGTVLVDLDPETMTRRAARSAGQDRQARPGLGGARVVTLRELLGGVAPPIERSNRRCSPVSGRSWASSSTTARSTRGRGSAARGICMTRKSAATSSSPRSTDRRAAAPCRSGCTRAPAARSPPTCAARASPADSTRAGADHRRLLRRAAAADLRPRKSFARHRGRTPRARRSRSSSPRGRWVSPP